MTSAPAPSVAVPSAFPGAVPAPAATPVTAPGKPKLYISFSGTQRDDWAAQLAAYGLLIFLGGVLIGRTWLKPKAKACAPRSSVRLSSKGKEMLMLQRGRR